MNGDGVDDLVVTAPGDDTNGLANNGAAYIVYGQSQAGAATTFTAITDLDALVTAGMAKVISGVASQDHFGSSVTMGDFNGDGISDLNVSASGVDSGATLNAGSTYNYFGATSGLTQGFSSSNDVLAAGTHGLGFAAIVGGVDRISGGLGNDNITGIGSASDTGNNGLHDVAYGGAGNDRIEIVGLNFSRVDGGLGNDTLALTGSNLSLNLSTQGNKVQGFENFELGNHTNMLTLRITDVLQMSESLTGTNHVTVSGGATDTLDLVGATWTNSGATTLIGGNTYDLWSSSLLPTTNHKDDVWVQQGVIVV